MECYKSKINARIHYIDVMRGLLILLVVLGHSIGNTSDPLNMFILSFHMPAFFILSGMCFKPKDSNYNFAFVLKRKAKGLIWPYLTFSLVGVALYWFLQAGTKKDIDVTFVQSAVGVFCADDYVGRMVTPGFWFVYDLIWVTLFHIFTKRISRVVKLVSSIVLFLFLYNVEPFYLSSELIRISVGFMFFTIGDMFSVYKANLSIVILKHWGGQIPGIWYINYLFDVDSNC